MIVTRTIHTSNIMESVSVLNERVTSGTYIAVISVAGYDAEVVDNVNVPITNLTDAMWPEFIRNAVSETQYDKSEQEDNRNFFYRIFQGLFN